jgi:23S rRNA pseudouridine2605 synthase
VHDWKWKHVFMEKCKSHNKLKADSQDGLATIPLRGGLGFPAAWRISIECEPQDAFGFDRVKWTRNIIERAGAAGGKVRIPMVERVMNSKRVGLARALSKLGYCSRSQAVALIRAGRVRLNGTTKQDPETPVRLLHDRIEVDRRAVEAESRIYLMLNKPRGVVTTASDEKGRETVYSCLGDGLRWVGPVGRLDKASEGLLLLTNDSEWAARISDPRTHVDKTYHVQVGALADEELEAVLTRGVHAASGELLRAKQAHALRTGERNAWLEIVLDEGKNRQIRRMFELLENEVLRLVRVAVGPLQLGQLAKGKFRALTAKEKAAMDQAMKSSDARPAMREE